MSAINSSVTTSVDPVLLKVPFQLNIWLGLFIFITGNISTIGNFTVFTSRMFRNRACSIYLIAESICTFIYFDFVLVTRLIQKGFNYPIINLYDPICKVRQFFSEYTHQVAFTLFALATIDRILSTHRDVAYRRWSNCKTLAYKIIPTVVFTWFICVWHRLYFYNITSGSCNPTPGIYEKIDSYFEVVMSGFVPPILLITLGCLLLRNVRGVVHRRIVPAGVVSQPINTNLSHIQQIDSQLTAMILLQSFVAIPSFIPFGAQNLYTSLSRGWYKTPLRLAWEDVIIETIRLFSYLFYSTSFYVSLYSSRGFRKQVLHSLRIKKYKPQPHITTTYQ
ncbi:unnamed protein product [Adineta steineri]|uniref:G-protein coupled receptors family 1 profile domain-containing protein n=1 Tax=Adineta steineri TaxID=433720 RepID=A0A814FGE1_9BILA|nr:unnamed protein product [Adineta steineri]CAF0980991.1 unnamed protein product [Adineta steineri]